MNLLPLVSPLPPQSCARNKDRSYSTVNAIILCEHCCVIYLIIIVFYEVDTKVVV